MRTLADTGTCIAEIGRLVAFPTVSRDPNRDLIEHAARHLAGLGIASDLIWNAEGTKANLWATIGPASVPGVILSGHSDVVPVDGQDWTSDPFVLRRTDDRLYGRGTADMKGFVGIMLAIAPELARRKLRAPVHLAISYDEELGCTGVVSLAKRIAGLPVKPALCIVGEPTRMQPVIAHKGGGFYRATVTGRPAHSSLAPRTVNTIEVAAELVVALRGIAHELAAGLHDHDYDVSHSTMTVTTIEGGTAPNIVPERCSFTFDIRSLPETDPAVLLGRLRNRAAELEAEMRRLVPQAAISVEEIVGFVPLDTPADHPALTFLRRLLGRNDHAKVAYGTEGGIFSRVAGVTSVVCGPGSIEQAHKADEFIEIAEIDRCREFLDRLAGALEAEAPDWA